jgi:hypothetical protein
MYIIIIRPLYCIRQRQKFVPRVLDVARYHIHPNGIIHSQNLDHVGHVSTWNSGHMISVSLNAGMLHWHRQVRYTEPDRYVTLTPTGMLHWHRQVCYTDTETVYSYITF